MKINILGSKIELTQAIKDYVTTKVSSLDKFYNGILEARVEVGMTTNHHQKGDIFRAEVNLRVPGNLIRAEAVSDDLYKSINQVKDELQRQLKKYKGKSGDHNR